MDDDSDLVVEFTTFSNPELPVTNMLDGLARTFCVTTGLFPQTILLHERNGPRKLHSIKIWSTGVRRLVVERTENKQPIQFVQLFEAELHQEMEGSLQTEVFTQSVKLPTTYLKITIDSGWTDFASIHNIHIQYV